MKQETLEEVAEKLATMFCSRNTKFWENFKLGAIEGLKFQQQDKKIYSEEDLKCAFFSGCQSERQFKTRLKCWEEFIEHFKNK
jgi:hypothetical protein